MAGIYFPELQSQDIQDGDLISTSFTAGTPDFIVRDNIKYQWKGEVVERTRSHSSKSKMTDIDDLKQAEEPAFNPKNTQQTLDLFFKAINQPEYQREPTYREATEGLQLFSRLATNYLKIKEFIDSSMKKIEIGSHEEKILVLTACQEKIYSLSGFSTHLLGNDSIGEGTGLDVFLNSAELILSFCDANKDTLIANPHFIIEKFNCFDPCFEARQSHFWGLGHLKKTSVIDKDKSTDDNLVNMVTVYFEKHKSTDPKLFTEWIINENGILGALTHDGRITKDLIVDFVTRDIYSVFATDDAHYLS